MPLPFRIGLLLLFLAALLLPSPSRAAATCNGSGFGARFCLGSTAYARCHCDGKPGSGNADLINPIDGVYHPETQSWSAVCWSRGLFPPFECSDLPPSESGCDDACFNPPPDCEDGKNCSCGPNGETLPVIGDPVHAVTGESILVETDLTLGGSLAPTTFTRRYTSSPLTWLNEGLVHSLPKPFGSSPSNASTLNWWHDYYSFVYVSSSRWAVVKETGAVTRFTPCTGIPCTATPSGGSLSKKERLQRTSSGFILTDSEGRKRYFEAKHVEAGSTRERYFLSKLIAQNGAQEAVLTYAAPPDLSCPAGGTGSAAGVPYLASVQTPSGGLDFQYTQLSSAPGSECVIRSLKRRGESTPAVIYYYLENSTSNEMPGLLARAAFATKSLMYGYSSSALTVSVGVGGVALTRHDYTSGTTSVATATSPGESLTLGALTSSTCQPGSNCCGVQPQARTATDAYAGRGDGLTGASGFVRTHETLSNADQTTSPRLYQTSDACSVAGACSPGTDRYEWACAASGLPAYEKARKNKRNFWEVYTYASPSSSTGMPASLLEKTGLKRGATDMTGTGSLEEESFGYSYGPHGEQLLAFSEKPSLLGASGQKARTFHRYDSTGRLEATIQSGWTRAFDTSTGTWSNQQRWVGTFFLTTRSGESTPDSLGRTLEQQGPCFVSSEAATACPSGTPFPLTRTYYWPDTETSPRRNQLRKLAVYPAGPSSSPLETSYNAYDASGKVTESVDANGVTTLSSYLGDLLVSQTVRVSGQPDVVTAYGHDAAGQLTYVLHPQGNYEVYCYRQGTTAGCVGGTLTNKLQWKAKSSTSTAATWSEKVTYTYWLDGTRNEERYLDASGATRRILSYAADAHRRPSWAKTGTGTGSFVATKGYDATNNASGEGRAFNSPPAWCAVDANGLPTSAACTTQQYDGANRLLRLDEHPTSSSTNRTCFRHDAHGNLTSVDVGVPATTDCATATHSSKALRYQFDDFGNLVESTIGAIVSSPTRYAHDAMGNLLVRQTPAMAAAHARDYLGYSHDTLGRMLSATHFSPLVPGGAEGLHTKGYDNSATPPSSCGLLTHTLGRLLYQDDSFGRTWYSYDAWGRVTQEVRLRVGTSTCSPSTPYSNPHTLYAYNANGNLTQITYPYGRIITYAYGADALADRVSGVNILTYAPGGASTVTPVVSQVAWEPYGGLRGYRTHYAGTLGSVEYALGDNASAAPSACPSSLPSLPGDSTGRIRALWVSSLASGANFSPGSGNGAVFKQLYTWQADQLVRADSCLLGASSPRIETYGYDAQLRLTGATGTLSTTGGAFSTRTFGLDARDNRTAESSEANGWAFQYSSTLPDRVLSRNSTQSGSSLGHSYQYDADGRVFRKDWRQEYGGFVIPGDPPFWMDFGSGPSASGATDSVFKSLTLRSLVFEYFYDAESKRRIKVYPTGIHDEYFYDRDKRMLLDQGNPSALPSSSHPVDEYVWLDERPIALIRSKLDASWFHEGTADCTRLGDFSPCGVYHLVTDYLGKPVLMIDSQGRVTGTGEYAPSGHVNRVSVDIETPHPYTTTTAAFGSVMKQPAVSGTSLQQRVLFDNLGLFNQQHDCPSGGVQGRNSNALLSTTDDSIDIQDATTNTPLVTVTSVDSGGGKNHGHQWTPWFAPGANGVKVHLNNSGIAYCEEGFDCSGIQCIPVCGCNTTATQKRRIGATISAYEYRRFQTGATPAWTPLRYPGQYFDVESDLFENWNRFYDPNLGRYLQPEPLLQDPNFSIVEAKEGRTMPAYAYAFNNPMAFIDPTGLQGTCSGGRCAGPEVLPSGGAGAAGGAAEAAAAATAAAAAAAAAKDCEDKNRCAEHYTRCQAKGGGVMGGRVDGESRCGSCLNYCTSNGFWPAAVYSWNGRRMPCPG
nr:RHS repeat-associated core domain-containing protein [Myxococcus sp. CA040A]